MTNSDILQLQKHNAALVKENAALTRDNAELRGHIEAIKQVATYVCDICKHSDLSSSQEPCKSCDKNNHNWTPPDA